MIRNLSLSQKPSMYKVYNNFLRNFDKLLSWQVTLYPTHRFLASISRLRRGLFTFLVGYACRLPQSVTIPLAWGLQKYRCPCTPPLMISIDMPAFST